MGSWENRDEKSDIEYIHLIFKDLAAFKSNGAVLTSIWGIANITDKTMLDYHHVLGHFSNKNFPLFLCEQLLDLNATMHRWAEKGTKGKKNTPYKFYVSEIDLGNTFVLFRKYGTINCDLKLFNINHFDIFDLQFCHEIENWLNSAIQGSTLISGSSEIQRYQFFNRQRQKICALMDKMFKNS